MTHTYAILEISVSAFAEIKAKLEAAGYSHAFHEDAGEGCVIDMHGIAIKAAPSESDQPDATAKIIESLNTAFAADPAAIHSLIVNRVPCNQALADHPHVEVDEIPVLAAKYFTVGALGLLNGCLRSAGITEVAARFTEERDSEGRAKLIGFTRYEKQKDSR